MQAMPDNDLVPRSIRRLWRRSCEAMLGGQEPQVVADEIDRAITETVKKVGLPPPVDLVRAMRDSVLYADTALYEEATYEYARRCGLTDLGSHVIAEARELMELRRTELLGRAEAETARDLVAGGLRRHAEACRCGPEAVTDRMLADGASLAHVLERQRACLDAAQYPVVAERVIEETSGHMRAPASQLPKLSQADLINEVL